MLKAPFRSSFQFRADLALNDGTTGFDGLALNEDAISAGYVNFFNGAPLVDLAPTSPDGTRGSTATTLSEETGAALISLNVETAPELTIAEGASVEIDGTSPQSVTFTGTTGTLKIDHSLAFAGQVAGLAGSDGIDLADVVYGANTQVTFLGNTTGGTLTVTDGTNTANIALQGNYLSSTWTLSSDGNGGTVVVDPVASSTWQTLKVGAGGFVRNLDVAPDGTMVGRTDSYGAYRWNGTQWVQLVTSTSMPAAFVAATQNTGDTGQGVYEIQIADSNTQILYMMYDGYVFKSTNQGTTWTQTSFAQVSAYPNEGNAQYGQKMAIDPNNPNIVYVGTPSNGLWVTKDGGTTWQQVSPVPAASAQDSSGITGILFDPAVGGVVNGVTQTIFAESNGNGVYKSTNGGASWTLLSGGPTTVTNAAVSSTGVYYASDGANLWSYANGRWTELPTGMSGQGIQAVAVNPFNTNEIVVVSPGGTLSVTYDGGVTWSGVDWNSNQVSSTDIPWLQSGNQGPNFNFLDIGGVAFSPLVPNQLIASAGTGVWNTTIPSNLGGFTPVTWNDQSLGIEQLVANEIIVPPGGHPVLASWDRPFFYISDLNAYPSTYGPVNSVNIDAGWSVDYASSSPNFIAGLISHGVAVYSTDGGQTWNNFASEPVFPGQANGGSIAASTPQNIIVAPADGVQPYYTLNGGATWNPVNLPGVTDWSGFEGPYYLDERSVVADRVLANTFYLYYPGDGVYKTTNGGVSWTQVYSGNSGFGSQFNGDITPFSWYNNELMSVPGQAGNLFFTGGAQSGVNPDTLEPFMRSTDGGASWVAVPNVLEVTCFGFGAPATPGGYPAVYIVGYVNNVYGIWQSVNNAQSWTQIGTYANNSLDNVKTIAGDPNIFGQVYLGFAGSGYAVLQAQPTGPAVTAVVATPSTGDLKAASTVTLMLDLNSAVTVAGGTPTLTLNDGGTATYKGGSGTSALTFTYTVGAGQNTASLAATAINLNGATMQDSGGNAASLYLGAATQTGPQIDTTAPTVAAVVESPSSGHLNTGSTVTLTLAMSEKVTVNTTGGTPTLTLNDGGTATYASGSGSNTLVFTYTIGAGQLTTSLAATAFNLNGATISDGAGNAANPSLSGLVQTGPQINTTAQALALDGNGFSNALGVSSANVTLTTANAKDVIILNVVENGTAVSSISDTAGLTWTLKAVAGTTSGPLYQYYAIAPNALSADTITVHFTGISPYVDLNAFGISGANTSSPFDTHGSLSGTSNSSTVSATTSNANDFVFAAYRFGATSSPSAGSGWNTINASGGYYLSEYQIVSATQAGLVATASATDQTGGIVTAVVAAPLSTGPTLSSIVESPSTGDLNAGKTVTLTLNFSGAMTVAGGTPTLTLNDGGTATYTGGTGSNALTFSYTVGVGQNSASLAATGINLNGATLKDGSGTAADLSLSGLTQTGPQIDTTTPTVASLVASGTGITAGAGDLGTGKVVTLTLNLSEAVTVAGGTPTLTLNDGGTATYTGGTGTSALTFSYTVGAGQNTTDLTVTAFNLGTATVKDGAGNAANLSGGVTNPSGTLQIDTTAPTVAQVIASPGSGIEFPGDTVTLTLTMNEAVTVTGTPTLTLNDGGIATYTGGSGTNVLKFSYTVGSTDNTVSALAITGANLPNGATIKDAAGNVANLSGALTTFPNLAIDPPSPGPTLTSVVTSPSSGSLNAGDTITLTLYLSGAVTVAGGTPTLSLNDGGTATYVGGTGTNALNFSYTVAAGQNTADLTVTAINLGTASVKDSAGNAANLTGLTANPAGTLQIDTTTPTVASVVASGMGITAGTGKVGTGSVVTLTLSLSEAVTVAGGIPTLTLNDGGIATYKGGTGGNALTFSYTVAAGQNIADLAVTAVNLGTATVKDSSGNAANLSGAVTNPGGTLQIATAATTTIETSGSTSLVQVGSNYFLGQNGLALKYGGVAYVAGQFSGWVPIGAEATSSGYDVAWKNTATGLYTVWSTDSNGNFTSNLLRNLSGKNTSLESIETLFKQDLNRDGMIGVPTTIEAFGSTSMVQAGNNYFLGQNGLALKYGGVAYVAGQFSGWVPIGAEATSSGYDVAWKNTATGLYTVWSTDSNGNFTSNILSNVSQTDASLKSIETSFHQDLNGDGVIGILATPIEAFGSTKLDQVANNYYLDSGSAGSGPLLKYAGAAVVAGQFYPWTPIAVEATAGGYEVAWKLPGTDQYTIWNTDSSGNYLSSPYGNLSGSSTTFKSLESSFQQDLNGDGVIAIAAGQTMELTGASSGVITFAGATGTLKIDHSASFSDPIGGQLAIGDVIDLADITAGANATIGYSGKNSPGTLTVSDGTHTASIALLGNYSLANFTASSDGKGGTSVIDPPLSTDQSGYLPSKQLGVDSVAWLSALDTRLALWSQQMASSFPSSSFDGLGSKLDNSEFGASGLGVQLATPTANSKYLSSLQG